MREDEKINKIFSIIKRFPVILALAGALSFISHKHDVINGMVVIK
jgi:hypothetical protein